jgi:hypothetical protein
VVCADQTHHDHGDEKDHYQELELPPHAAASATSFLLKGHEVDLEVFG